MMTANRLTVERNAPVQIFFVFRVERTKNNSICMMHIGRAAQSQLYNMETAMQSPSDCRESYVCHMERAFATPPQNASSASGNMIPCESSRARLPHQIKLHLPFGRDDAPVLLFLSHTRCIWMHLQQHHRCTDDNVPLHELGSFRGRSHLLPVVPRWIHVSQAVPWLMAHGI